MIGRDGDGANQNISEKHLRRTRAAPESRPGELQTGIDSARGGNILRLRASKARVVRSGLHQFSGSAIAMAALVATTLLAVQPAAAEAGSARWTVFSDAEISRLYTEIGTQLERERRDAVFVGNVEGDVVLLEPYVVQGDTTLLPAALRRQLELGPESIQRRVQEMAASQQGGEATITARAADRFMTGPTLGAPADRPGLFPLDSNNLRPLGRSVIRFIEDTFNQDRRE